MSVEGTTCDNTRDDLYEVSGLGNDGGKYPDDGNWNNFGWPNIQKNPYDGKTFYKTVTGKAFYQQERAGTTGFIISSLGK